MQSTEHQVTLSNLSGGIAEILFQQELEKVLANCLDPQTDPDAVREIHIKAKILPKSIDDRNEAALRVTVSSKLAPRVSPISELRIDESEDGLVASDPQLQLPGGAG